MAAADASETYSPLHYLFVSDGVQSVNRFNKLRRIDPFFSDLPKDHNSAISKLCEMKAEAESTNPQFVPKIIEEIIVRVYFLLPHHAKKHAGKLFMKLPHCVFEDAVQNMILNVMTAIQKFDPSRGNKFSNYILMYLQDGLFKAVKQSNIVNSQYLKPTHNVATPDKIRLGMVKALQIAEEEEEEDSDELSLHNNKVLRGAQAVIAGRVEFDNGLAYSIEPGYYSETPDMNEDLYNEEISIWLHYALNPENGILNDDEVLTIKHHFGVFGCAKLKLKDIASIRKAKGKGFATTRIFQIEKEALAKLKDFFSQVGVEYEPV